MEMQPQQKKWLSGHWTIFSNIDTGHLLLQEDLHRRPQVVLEHSVEQVDLNFEFPIWGDRLGLFPTSSLPLGLGLANRFCWLWSCPSMHDTELLSGHISALLPLHPCA